METTVADKTQIQSKSSKTMSLDRNGPKHSDNITTLSNLQPAEVSKPQLNSSAKFEKETKNVPSTPQTEINIDSPVSRERSSSSVGKEAETE